MKLHHYVIRSALAQCDYRAAEEALCQHFRFSPSETKPMRLKRHYSQIGISFWTAGGCYQWFPNSGFELSESPLSSGKDTVIFWGPDHRILGEELIL